MRNCTAFVCGEETDVALPADVAANSMSKSDWARMLSAEPALRKPRSLPLHPQSNALQQLHAAMKKQVRNVETAARRLEKATQKATSAEKAVDGAQRRADVCRTAEPTHRRTAATFQAPAA